MANQENTSPLSPSLNSSLIPMSSSLHPSSSSSSVSPPKLSQKLPVSSSYSLSPLPSSSFLVPLPTASFSSSIHPLTSSSSSLYPLPSSLCSLPSLSPTGGRKGRVCCGVCGKSFYDKGKVSKSSTHPELNFFLTVLVQLLRNQTSTLMFIRKRLVKILFMKQNFLSSAQ